MKANNDRQRRGGARGGGWNRRRDEAPEVDQPDERRRAPLVGLLVGASPALLARQRARGGRS